MKERPILFSAPMVRAILDGYKTQTRRIVKPLKTAPHLPTEEGYGWTGLDEHGYSGLVKRFANGGYSSCPLPICPYGLVGDRLWVRETFHVCAGAQRWKDGTVLYRADHGIDIGGSYVDVARWKPSIFMPRAASRISLEVTGIRIERLNSIVGKDAVAEGYRSVNLCNYPDAFHWYRSLWEEINGIGTWNANPWVWVVEFKRASVNGESAK